MNDENEYFIERFDAFKIKDLEKLFTDVYKKSTKKNYFLNKYNTSYTKISFVGYIAYQNEKPAAFYGVIPCFIQYKNEILLAAQSADTMTHPEHRGKGLFNKLAKMCFDLCKQNGIHFVFGFPNQNSFPGFMKLGFSVTETMACFQINLPVNIYKKLLNRIAKSNKNHVLSKYISSENGIGNSVINDGFFGIYRDENYLQYKKYRETFVLNISGSKFWIVLNNSLNIGDMICDEKHFDYSINEIKKIAERIGISTIYFHTSINTFLFNQFSKIYKSISSFPVIFLNFNDKVDVAKIKFTYADIDIF